MGTRFGGQGKRASGGSGPRQQVRRAKHPGTQRDSGEQAAYDMPPPPLGKVGPSVVELTEDALHRVVQNGVAGHAGGVRVRGHLREDIVHLL